MGVQVSARTARRRSRAATCVCLAAAVVCLMGGPWGCTPTLALPSQPTLPQPSSWSVASQVDLVLSQCPVDAPQPSWELTFTEAVTGSVSPDGSLVAIFGLLPRKGVRRVEVQVLDRRGAPVWSRRFEDANFRSGWARFLPDGRHLAIGAFNYNETGVLELYPARGGEALWRRNVSGPVLVTTPEEGDRLALIDYLEGYLHLIQASDGSELSRLRVGPGATCQFVALGEDLLVVDGGQVMLWSGGGQDVWRYALDAATLREVGISRDGAHLAVTTGEADSSVYLFDRSRRLKWKYLLFPGGTNDIQFSPDGRLLAVYNAGRRAGIYVFRTGTGELLWRLFFAGEEADDGDINLRHLDFSSDGRFLLLDAVVVMPGQPIQEEHQLILLGPTGTAQWRIHLGRDLDVAVGPGCRTAAICGRPQADASGQVFTAVRCYDLERLYPPASQDGSDRAR